MKKRRRLKCTLSNFCDDAINIHERNREEGKGLLIQSIINVKTGKRRNRLAYRDMRNSPLIWLSFCPWCGADQSKTRKETA